MGPTDDAHDALRPRDGSSLLAWVQGELTAGRTVMISTPYRGYQIDAGLVARWERSGRPLLRVRGNDIQIASGASYVCVNFCNFVSFDR